MVAGFPTARAAVLVSEWLRGASSSSSSSLLFAKGLGSCLRFLTVGPALTLEERVGVELELIGECAAEPASAELRLELHGQCEAVPALWVPVELELIGECTEEPAVW
mmetsp:Transcript_106730/g.301867  ORF Transcript_106730/g.301867 Transcript_106730/m.301867 type:complete len:107 (+) Transcript_106730:376-696(+)